MIAYINVDHNNKLVYDAPERVYNKSGLLSKFEEFIGAEGFKISWESRQRVPYVATIEKETNKYTLVMYLKNITGAG